MRDKRLSPHAEALRKFHAEQRKPGLVYPTAGEPILVPIDPIEPVRADDHVFAASAETVEMEAVPAVEDEPKGEP